jgi:hypothetical protein
MHFFLRKESTTQHRCHDLCMPCDISLPLSVGMVRFPDVDVATTGLVPALSQIQRLQWLGLPQLLIMGCAVTAAAMPIRATREVATCPSAAYRLQWTLLVPLSRMARAPAACGASRKAKFPLAGLHLGQVVETARPNGAVRSHLPIERPQWAQRLTLPRLPVMGGAIALCQPWVVAAIEGARSREHVFDSSGSGGQMRIGFHRPQPRFPRNVTGVA